MAENIASAPKRRFDKFFRLVDLIKHKGFYSFLFLTLSVILILVTFTAVKEQTGYNSRAASVCGGLTQEACDEKAPQCKWDITVTPNKCVNAACNEIVDPGQCILIPNCFVNPSTNKCIRKCSSITNETNCTPRDYCEWKENECVEKNVISGTIIPSISTTPIMSITSSPSSQIEESLCANIKNETMCINNNKCIWITGHLECQRKCENRSSEENCMSKKTFTACSWDSINNRCFTKCDYIGDETLCLAKKECVWDFNIRVRPYKGNNKSCMYKPNSVCYDLFKKEDCIGGHAYYYADNCKWWNNKCYPMCSSYTSPTLCESSIQNCKWIGRPTSGSCTNK